MHVKPPFNIPGGSCCCLLQEISTVCVLCHCFFFFLRLVFNVYGGALSTEYSYCMPARYWCIFFFLTGRTLHLTHMELNCGSRELWAHGIFFASFFQPFERFPSAFKELRCNCASAYCPTGKNAFPPILMAGLIIVASEIVQDYDVRTVCCREVHASLLQRKCQDTCEIKVFTQTCTTYQRFGPFATTRNMSGVSLLLPLVPANLVWIGL